MTEERYSATSRGGILYDPSRLRKPQAAVFEPGYWQARGALEQAAGGRGSIAIVQADAARWVLRHYLRGGWVAKLSRDSYLWRGEARTRSFAEWRLLAELRRRGLPVPAPVAACYERNALTYRADLITELLPQTQTLAEAICTRVLPAAAWEAVGRTIGAFHREGVRHADLNAHNILLGEAALAQGAPPPVHLLDFDRGRFCSRGSWEREVLERLRRSLEKVRRQRPGARWQEADWQCLARACEAAAG